MNIPESALQQHIAVLGKTGSGKTFAAKSVIVEPLLERRARVGVIDPTGAWWGLRHARSGKGAGYPILVLGGDHGDLPLPAQGGAAVAGLLVEQNVNLVADTSQLTVGERTRWFIDFASTVHRLNRAPLHLILDEAHNFAPQGKVLDPDAGKMLHAANRLAAEGRSRGVRLTLITQRPQKLHKDALTSADTLIAMRVLAPHDRAAVKDWIDGCGDLTLGKDVLASLASLARGEGWVWYPEGSFLQRMKFPDIQTFDSSATPTGGAVQAPKGAAEIDLAEIRAVLADAVREAEANDPKLLRAEIARLRKLAELRATSLHEPDPAALEAAGRDGFAQGLRSVEPALDRMNTLSSALLDTVQGAQQDIARLKANAPRAALPPADSRLPKPVSFKRTTNDIQPLDAGPVSAPQQRILDALAWLQSVGIGSAHKIQLALLADQSPKSSGYANNLGALRTARLIDYPGPSMVQLTSEGFKAARGPESPPTTADLHAALRSKLAAPQWRIVEALIRAYPKNLDRQVLAEQADQSVNSSGYANNLGALRSLGFIDYPAPGRVAALPVLFLQ